MTTPLTKLRLLLCFLCPLLILVSCIERTADYYLTLHNNSRICVTYAFGRNYPNDSSRTIYSTIKPNEYVVETNGIEKKASWRAFFEGKYGHRYLSIFFINSEIKDKFSHNYNKTSVIRYDLTLEDLEYLDWSVTYPPTQEMKDVHMNPPYSDFIEQ